MDRNRCRPRLMACLLVAIGLCRAGAIQAQETIYVGQNDPAAMHAYTFDGSAFTEQTLDPDSPGKYLRGGVGPFLSAVSDHFFLFAGAPGPISVVDPASGIQFPAGAATPLIPSAIIPIENKNLAIEVGDDVNGLPMLSVFDISPANPGFTGLANPELQLLPVQGSSDPVLQSASYANAGGACLSSDGTLLYVTLSGADLGGDGAIVAIDLTALPAVSIRNAVRIPGLPASNVRAGTIGGASYLFVMGGDLDLIPVSDTAFGTPIHYTSGSPDAPLGRYFEDVYVEDGPSPKLLGVTISYKDFNFMSAVDELLTIDLSGALADNGGDCTDGGPRPCASSVASVDSSADGSGMRIEPSLDASYLFVLESAADPLFCPSRLHAFSLSALNSGSSGAEIANTFIDFASLCPPPLRNSDDFRNWLQRPELVAWGVGLTVRNAVTPSGSGINVSDANTETGKVFTNDTSHFLTVSGSGLNRVVRAYLGQTTLTISSATNSSLTATIPPLVPSGGQVLGLTDSTGGLTVFPTLFLVNNSALYLPKAVVYAVGATGEQYTQINTASGSEVVSNFPTNTQGTFVAKVTKDGKYLITSGFRDGRVSIHSLIANPNAPDSNHTYGWNTFVDALYAAGDSGIVQKVVQNPVPGRNTMYVNNDYDAIYMIDPTAFPPSLMDADGDTSTTDPGMESYPGVSGIPIPQDNYRSLVTFADCPARQYLYTAASGKILRIDVSSDVVTAANVTVYATGLPDGGRGRGLAISPDGTRLYFESIREAAVRVYSRNTADGSIDTSTYTTIAPPDGWQLGDSLFLLVSPDGRSLYAASPFKQRLDIFDIHDPSNVTDVASVPLPGGPAGLDATPAGDYLFVALGNDSVVAVYEGPAMPGLTPHQILSSTTSASGTADVALSPGAGTDAGTAVTVTPTQGSTITYAAVTTAGNTTVTSSNSSAITVPANFEIAVDGQAPVFYDVSTTALFNGPVTVCFACPVSSLSSDAQQTLVLMHQQGSSFAGIPTTADAVNNRVCGQVSSFSQFVIAETTVGVSIATQSNFKASGGGNLNVTIFGSPTFDATQIDASTLILLPQGVISTFESGAKVSGTQDINKDHLADLTVSFPRQNLRISGSSGSIYLQGRLFDGTAFSGQGTVTLK